MIYILYIRTYSIASKLEKRVDLRRLIQDFFLILYHRHAKAAEGFGDISAQTTFHDILSDLNLIGLNLVFIKQISS